MYDAAKCLRTSPTTRSTTPPTRLEIPCSRSARCHTGAHIVQQRRWRCSPRHSQGRIQSSSANRNRGCARRPTQSEVTRERKSSRAP
eukprot:761077-Hanusia_phi.AAC.3